MQLSNYAAFPTTLPVIAEDELFLYPFMISPLFLSDEKNIAAAAEAIENNSLIIVILSLHPKDMKVLFYLSIFSRFLI